MSLASKLLLQSGGGLLNQLDPASAVLPVIALIGLFPVLLHYRHESRLFAVAYACLAIATLATNLEDLFLGTVLNYTEHFIGLGGSGVALFAAAYVRYNRVTASAGNQTDASGSRGTTSDGQEVSVDG